MTEARRRGMRVLARNVRGPRGELDLVLRDKRVLVFCEVKARRHERHGAPEAAVTREKQRRLIHTARWFIRRGGVAEADVACRFDVCAIRPGADGRPEVRWIERAFEER